MPLYNDGNKIQNCHAILTKKNKMEIELAADLGGVCAGEGT